MFRRLSCPPDVSGFSRGRRWWSSWCRRSRPFAKVGIHSRRSSGASWILRYKLADRRKKLALLGSTEAAGGGGSEMLLLGLSGGLRLVAGCLVKVCGGLNWAVECCGGSWLMGWILDRSWRSCLLWMVEAVVGCWTEAWEGWKGGVSVSCWEDLGRVLGSRKLGILKKGGGGCW